MARDTSCFWLIADDVEYVADRGDIDQPSEATGPQPDGPSSRLSTVDEEPSDLTEYTMFIHDEPNWEAADRAATRACLLCAKDCIEENTQPEPTQDIRIWEFLFTDEVEALLASHIADSVIVGSLNPAEEYSEICYAVENSKVSLFKDIGRAVRRNR